MWKVSELFSCKKCDFTTIRLGHLRRHEMSHSDTKFTCDMCHYHTDHHKFLLRHQRIKHANVQVCICFYFTLHRQSLFNLNWNSVSHEHWQILVTIDLVTLHRFRLTLSLAAGRIFVMIFVSLCTQHILMLFCVIRGFRMHFISVSNIAEEDITKRRSVWIVCGGSFGMGTVMFPREWKMPFLSWKSYA
jgi:hypothetical protein